MRHAAFETYGDDADGWRWRLRAANGRILASGESFVSEANANRAIRDVVRAAVDAMREPVRRVDR